MRRTGGRRGSRRDRPPSTADGHCRRRCRTLAGDDAHVESVDRVGPAAVAERVVVACPRPAELPSDGGSRAPTRRVPQSLCSRTDILVAPQPPRVRSTMTTPMSDLTRETLARVAPGTGLRDGLERILRGGTGALIVLGHDDDVERSATAGSTRRRVRYSRRVCVSWRRWTARSCSRPTALESCGPTCTHAGSDDPDQRVGHPPPRR